MLFFLRTTRKKHFSHRRNQWLNGLNQWLTLFATKLATENK